MYMLFPVSYPHQVTGEHKAHGCLYSHDFPMLKQADITQRAPQVSSWKWV